MDTPISRSAVCEAGFRLDMPILGLAFPNRFTAHPMYRQSYPSQSPRFPVRCRFTPHLRLGVAPHSHSMSDRCITLTPLFFTNAFRLRCESMPGQPVSALCRGHAPPTIPVPILSMADPFPGFPGLCHADAIPEPDIPIADPSEAEAKHDPSYPMPPIAKPLLAEADPVPCVPTALLAEAKPEHCCPGPQHDLPVPSIASPSDSDACPTAAIPSLAVAKRDPSQSFPHHPLPSQTPAPPCPCLPWLTIDTPFLMQSDAIAPRSFAKPLRVIADANRIMA